MSRSESQRSTPLHVLRAPGWDVALLAVLLFAVLQITGLAESAALPTRVADALRHPILGALLPQSGYAAFGEVGPRPGDPIGLLLVACALGGALLYALADLGLRGAARRRLKWALLAAILACAVFLPAAKLILLRAQSGPASYSHDGGVIQTEATIAYLLEGRNPYSEDYVETPMAEWGFSEYRTALYHYPYLPWTFLFSAPFYLAGQTWGGYDQRVVYLLLMAVALLLAPRLVHGERRRLALVMLLGLNPLMALDLIFGQNDSFVLCWVIFSLAAWQVWRERLARGQPAYGWRLAAALLFGLACASKPTAWFFAPWFALLLVADAPPAVSWRDTAARFWRGLLRLWPAATVAVLTLLPWLLWDWWSLYDDVWRWSGGQGETGYQIWGWGASNFVLAAGWVADRFQPWPFLLIEAALGVPLMLWFVRRQTRDNTLAAACWHYAIWLFAFFYVSRFLNENYLGYIAAFVALGSVSTETEVEAG